MDSEIVKMMLARLARWAAVALISWAVSKGWLNTEQAGQVAGRLADLLLQCALIVVAALAAGWLAIREKLRVDVERVRTDIALTLPANATRQQLEAARLSQVQIARDAAMGGDDVR